MEISFNERLKQVCREKNNHLCIGLDLDVKKFPEGADRSLRGMETFAKAVVDETINFCPVYKPNFAFFERFGSAGLAVLERLVEHINNRAIIIADAKRGDIGNTSRQYALGILGSMGCDAITVSPYMGRDAVAPFLENPAKGVFVLALTSNKSALEIQGETNDGIPLFIKITRMASEMNSAGNVGLVVGATKPEEMEAIRNESPGLPWLIPGVGAQGGDLETALKLSNQNGLGIINVSRSILYAGDGSMKAVVEAAKNYTEEIRKFI